MPTLAVVIPIGPKCLPEFVADTIESIRKYSPPGSPLFLVDDSGKDTGSQVADPNSTVIPAARHGALGNLYINLTTGFRAALEQPFDVLLRIDTDGLVAAPFLDRAHAHFEEHPHLGSLGSFRTSYTGQTRSFSWSRRRLVRSMTLYAPKHPATALAAASATIRAKRNGYQLGEGIMGGVALYSRQSVEALNSAALLPDQRLAETGLQEDQIFALSLRAIGCGLADFGTRSDDLPFGVKHVGLPAHPEELLDRGKALIHSTKSYGKLTEREIRAIFARARASA